MHIQTFSDTTIRYNGFLGKLLVQIIGLLDHHNMMRPLFIVTVRVMTGCNFASSWFVEVWGNFTPETVFRRVPLGDF